MDYEKKYKELVGKIDKAYLSAQTDSTKAVLEEIRPELKEDKDDRIRKEIFKYIDKATGCKRWVAWLEKQGNTNIFDVPEISIKNAVEVTSRMQYIDDDIKPIAEFIMDYANWDLHKDEWNKPTLTVPLFRVLDALIQKGKPYCACNQNIEKQCEQKKQVYFPKFTFDDVLALQCCMETVKKVQEDKDLYEKLNDLHGRVYDAYHLEKQGEQKPADKAEPKFKVGDYVVDNCGYTWRIEGIINQFYSLEGIDGGESRPTIEWVNKTFHLWDITDAKDGDILHSTGFHNDCIFIFNGLDNWKFDEPNGDRAVATGYCCLSESADNMEFGMQGPDCVEVSTVKPATKIQRDLLFRKIKEAGYEWDAEKKELKEIENEEYDGEDYGIDSLWHAKNILKKTLGKVDGYQSDDGILEHKCAISAVDKLYKQKPSWSAEETFMVQRICKYLDAAKKYYVDSSEVRECIDWLKSLEERVLPSSTRIKASRSLTLTNTNFK